MTSLYIFATAAIVLIAIIVLFNQLIAKRQMVNNGWADIDVQLKRRADLIPQLVTTVQAYAAHEKTLFEEVAEKRNAALAGATPYLRLFGNAAGGCMLADEALAAHRLADSEPAARVAVARFFSENIAVQASGLERTVTGGADSVNAADAALTA